MTQSSPAEATDTVLIMLRGRGLVQDIDTANTESPRICFTSEMSKKCMAEFNARFRSRALFAEPALVPF